MVDATEQIQAMIPKVSGTQILNGFLIAGAVILVLGFIGFLVWKWFVKRKYNE